ncbi:hypothetical protein [Brevundimonas kwangchunensis]|uniref:hypothetical protein n=1 Tax=Brevundimonas kwangchunensis TaxID=322163 RepID=UPI0031E00E00
MDQLLLPHQALTSPDGQYSLAFRPSGRLELWLANAPVPSELASAFEVSAEGEARFLLGGVLENDARLELAHDGALRLLGRSGEELWRSASADTVEGGQ